jgi:hypothetical protein
VQDKIAGVTPRSFDPMSIPGLSDQARERVKDAFEAMSECQADAAVNTERNTKRVIKKIALAAAALGWPEQIVDAAREQMQSISEMQITTMDHMMDAWEEQLKLSLAASPSTMHSKETAPPDFGSAAATPLQLWMQSVEQWQRLWTDSMTAFLHQAGQTTGQRLSPGR